MNPRPSGSARWASFLHLVALWGFAGTQPIFEILARHPQYLVTHGMSPATIIAFTIGLIVIPPTLAFGIITGLRLVTNDRVGSFAQATAIGVLLALAVCPHVIANVSMPSGLASVSYLLVAVAGGAAYARYDLVKRYATWLTPAPLVFAFGFLVLGPASGYFQRVPEPRHTQAKPVSIVDLVLDELPLASLSDAKGRIDARRFPNFARLAKRSTWYSNATTNSNATTHAVPAALSGKFPEKGNNTPHVEDYPSNLFTLLAATHRLAAGEVMTRLCPGDRCERLAVPASAVKLVAADTALLYLHSVSPPAVREALPPLVTEVWGGFFADPLTIDARIENVPAILKPVGRWLLRTLADAGEGSSSSEVRRFESFIEAVAKPSRPTVWFHHALLPHIPWHMLEDTTRYDDVRNEGRVDLRWLSQDFADSALQRHLVQLKAVDLLLGRLMQRLEDQKMWDDILLVVQADHGITFKSGAEYRSIRGHEGDLLRIPLFVKYPGQRSAAVDRSNVELVDILPTVMDELDVRTDLQLDGRSLRKDDGARNEKLALIFDACCIDLTRGRLQRYDPDLPRADLLGQIRTLFGKARERDDLFAFGPHRELEGRDPATLETGRAQAVGLVVNAPERFAAIDPDRGYLPARVMVEASIRGIPTQVWVAASVNGRIAGFGRMQRVSGRSRASILLSPRYLHEGANELAFYAITGSRELTRLH